MNKLEIRKTQALYNYAGGSIADFPEVSLMICSPDIYSYAWGSEDQSHRYTQNRIEDDRLANLFKVEYFVQPPKPNVTSKFGIKAVRFPASMFCPNCRTIHFLENLLDLESEYYVDRNRDEILEFDKLNRGYFCPSCYEKSNYKNEIKLTPSRFIIANEYGLIDDFPWDWYCHRKEGYRNNRKRHGKSSCYYKKSGKSGRHLKLIYSGGKASLGDMSIECKECGAKENLGGIFNQEETFLTPGDNYLAYTKGFMTAPWKGYSSEDNEEFFFREKVEYINIKDLTDSNDEDLAKWKKISPRTLQRGAGNVHFPITHRAISLPRKSYEIKITPQLREQLDLVIKLKSELPEFEGLNKTEVCTRLLKKSEEDIYTFFKNVLKNKSEIASVKNYLNEESEVRDLSDTEEQNRLTEYRCFLNFNDENAEKRDWYKSTIVDESKYSGLNFLDKVVLLDKITQLNILKGFTRVKPLTLSELIFANDESDFGSSRTLQEEFNRIKDIRKYAEKTNWLPANEVKGEGIFITIKDSIIKDWIDHEPEITNRVNTIKQNYVSNLRKFNSDFVEADFNFISANYVFLHTLSHILIDQVAQHSGYNAASLSEIIYSNQGDSNSKEPMNGILIYTSSSDAEGTLGGLVNHGRPGKLEGIFRKGVEKARWCSSDPICIESRNGQGFMGVNMSACHACCMLPESCCENFNKFLDRGLLVGTLENKEIGFFNFLNSISK